jgi:phosphoribosylformylglycinamidine (FGAM) synthase-like amidotransferase family enzyme
MRLAVIVPAGQGGSAASAWNRTYLTSVVFVKVGDSCDFSEVDAVVATTALPASTPTARALAAFADDGGAVLGLGLGFAALCELGLLPGNVKSVISTGATSGHFRTEGQVTPFTAGIPASRVHELRLDIGYAYHHEAPIDLEKGGQVVFRYCDAWAGVSSKDNPLGSVAGIAGLSNKVGNVVGVAVDMQFDSPIAPGGLVDQLLSSASLWSSL